MEQDQIFALLRTVFLFHRLSDQELAEFLPVINPKLQSLPTDTTLVHAGTAADFMGIVVQGRLTAQHATISDNIYVAEQYVPTKLFGDNAVFSSPGTWPLDIVAAERSSVLTFSTSGLWDGLADDPASRMVRSALMKNIDDKNKALIHQISLAAPTVRGKVLTWFDLMNDKHKGKPFRFKMGRAEFAKHLGIGRTSLYRELSFLRECGAVAINSDQIVTVDSKAFPVLSGQP